MISNHKSYKKNNLRDVEKTFNDGICFLYQANERTLGRRIGKFYFAYESVGINHFYQSYNNNVAIDKAISIPINNETVNPQDVVKIGCEWYTISRIQYKDDKRPHHYILSLSRSPFKFVEVENANS